MAVAEYYLHLDDQTFCSPFFIHSIRNSVRKESVKRRTKWTALEFSSTISDPFESSKNETYSGLFLRTSDLPKLVHFLSTFEDVSHQIEMENETLYTTYDIFIRVVSQGSRLVQRPSLFHRRGVRGNGSTSLEIEDDFRKRWKSDDPAGKIVTNMAAVGSHHSSFVYGSDRGYFRASSPQRGDFISIIFDEDDVTLNRVKVDTGLPRENGELSDELNLPGGVIEASPKLLRYDAAQNIVRCADFVKIGDIKHGVAGIDDLRKSLWGRTTKCLRITVTEINEATDVIFSQISVYT